MATDRVEGARRLVAAERHINPVIPDEVIRLVDVLPSATVIVNEAGTVLYATVRAEALRLTRRGRIAISEIRGLVRRVVSEGVSLERQIRVPRPPLGRGLLDLRVLVTVLAPGAIAVVIDDLSDEARVEAVRRDFIANVSHELKTPVGAMALLAEAVVSASDDADAVRKFAERLRIEADRLASLVNDVIDLSRLQGDDPLSHALPIPVDELVLRAADDVAVVAATHDIEIVLKLEAGLEVLGDPVQLGMALRNLLVNAISYSPPHTRVAVVASAWEGTVFIDVKDQGIGIPPHDLERIFERFYRVDQARSRATGGTGLGLAIVKHVCQNHGGEVRVWSEVGVGSTFTLALPSLNQDDVEESDEP